MVLYGVRASEEDSGGRMKIGWDGMGNRAFICIGLEWG